MKALFLDRDGVINIDTGHVFREDKIIFNDIFRIVKHFYDKGYMIFVITNQAGIAKGYYSEDDFNTLTRFVERRFRDHQIKITKTYDCPHHIDAEILEYKKACPNRKPNPGMILCAEKEFNLDLSNSIFVGDSLSDIEAAEDSGIKLAILIKDNRLDLLEALING